MEGQPEENALQGGARSAHCVPESDDTSSSSGDEPEEVEDSGGLF